VCSATGAYDRLGIHASPKVHELGVAPHQTITGENQHMVRVACTRFRGRVHDYPTGKNHGLIPRCIIY
jgi:hypothetical protein